MSTYLHRVLFLVLGLSSTVQGTDGIKAFLRFSPQSLKDSRGCHLPVTLSFSIRAGPYNCSINVTTNTHVDVNVPVYTPRGGEGEGYISQSTLQIQTKFYHNYTSMTTMKVTCHRLKNGVQLVVSGSFMTKDGDVYSLERESRSLSETVQYNDVYRLAQDDVSYLNPHHDYNIPPSSSDEEVDVSGNHNSYRHRRQADDIFIDVLVFIEHSLYSRWYNRSTQSSETLRREEALQQIRQYYGYIVNGIDVRYKSYSPRMNIRLVGYMIEMSGEGEWIRRVRLNETQEYQDLYRVNGDRLQDGALQLKQNITHLPAHDHLMIFTAYDLYFQIDDTRGDLLGIAFYATVCKLPPFSISVIEDKEVLMSVIFTATHELAHGLGVDHDGGSNNCSSADRYIMSDGVGYQRTEYNTYNPYTFSPCSTLKLTQYISTQLDMGDESRRCLIQWIPASDVPDVTSSLPGQVYSAAQQCQIAHGDQSALCVGAYNGDLSALCSMMLCQDREDRCVDTFAAEGTECGASMWCLSGRCVNATMASSTLDMSSWLSSTGDATTSTSSPAYTSVITRKTSTTVSTRTMVTGKKTTDVKIFPDTTVAKEQGSVSAVVLGASIGGVGVAVTITAIVVVIICRRIRLSEGKDNARHAVEMT
ncbi:A disintegrin and metalloproteinase with thrombospondin motifs adt-1-like isoform X2 [Haliotis rufescens]|uniref:A disintegrin and metalloproteinase with thrombospondin motifs adt-1-like isoform X2 n=1 Tax=Haliotis rufescens TaxID=6454 RepID=UPI00201E89E7|nr:A disintegrin and metalloproteinase with thrombospondin motifs adt-1-like isoform X2 [Haliotis rufescens]